MRRPGPPHVGSEGDGRGLVPVLYGHLFPDQLDEVADRLDAAARAVVYPMCDRADIIPVSAG